VIAAEQVEEAVWLLITAPSLGEWNLPRSLHAGIRQTPYLKQI